MKAAYCRKHEHVGSSRSTLPWVERGARVVPLRQVCCHSAAHGERMAPPGKSVVANTVPSTPTTICRGHVSPSEFHCVLNALMVSSELLIPFRAYEIRPHSDLTPPVQELYCNHFSQDRSTRAMAYWRVDSMVHCMHSYRRQPK